MGKRMGNRRGLLKASVRPFEGARRVRTSKIKKSEAEKTQTKSEGAPKSSPEEALEAPEMKPDAGRHRARRSEGREGRSRGKRERHERRRRRSRGRRGRGARRLGLARSDRQARRRLRRRRRERQDRARRRAKAPRAKSEQKGQKRRPSEVSNEEARRHRQARATEARGRDRRRSGPIRLMARMQKVGEWAKNSQRTVGGFMIVCSRSVAGGVGFLSMYLDRKKGKLDRIRASSRKAVSDERGRLGDPAIKRTTSTVVPKIRGPSSRRRKIAATQRWRSSKKWTRSSEDGRRDFVATLGRLHSSRQARRRRRRRHVQRREVVTACRGRCRGSRAQAFEGLGFFVRAQGGTEQSRRREVFRIKRSPSTKRWKTAST